MLVVAGHDAAQDGHVRQMAQAQIGDHPVHDGDAAFDVRLHQVPFVGIQVAGLEQHVVGNADLADVVQRREKKDVLDEFVGQAAGGGEFLGDQAGVAGHAFEMRAGFEIAQVAEGAGDVHGAGQGADDEQFAGDEQGNEIGVEQQLALVGRGKGVAAAGIEEEEAGEDPLAVHGHGEGRQIALLEDPGGMGGGGRERGRNVVQQAQAAALREFVERAAVGHAEFVAAQGLAGEGAVDERLEQIFAGVVEGAADAVHLRDFPEDLPMQRSQPFAETDRLGHREHRRLRRLRHGFLSPMQLSFIVPPASSLRGIFRDPH